MAGRLGEARLVAPGSLCFELANVCLVKAPWRAGAHHDEVKLKCSPLQAGLAEDKEGSLTTEAPLLCNRTSAFSVSQCLCG